MEIDPAQIRGADGLRETESFTAAVDEYAKAFEQLAYLQRASARLILDALDRSFPPSAERTQVRERVLNTLAWYRKEIERWLEHEPSETLPND